MSRPESISCPSSVQLVIVFRRRSESCYRKRCRVVSISQIRLTFFSLQIDQLFPLTKFCWIVFRLVAAVDCLIIFNLNLITEFTRKLITQIPRWHIRLPYERNWCHNMVSCWYYKLCPNLSRLFYKNIVSISKHNVQLFRCANLIEFSM